tara:strand:- start:23 stop:193 length:171 start_codon:yes stop_codon:yes gene_type:complete
LLLYNPFTKDKLKPKSDDILAGCLAISLPYIFEASRDFKISLHVDADNEDLHGWHM